jgi:hypothetical protein
VPLKDLPDWLPAWCLDHLGGEPADVMFQLQQVSMVFGLRLPGGTDVVVKARADDGRAVSCVAVQALLAERGSPCARPLTPVVGVYRGRSGEGREVLRTEIPPTGPVLAPILLVDQPLCPLFEIVSATCRGMG